MLDSFGCLKVLNYYFQLTWPSMRQLSVAHCSYLRWYDIKIRLFKRLEYRRNNWQNLNFIALHLQWIHDEQNKYTQANITFICTKFSLFFTLHKFAQSAYTDFFSYPKWARSHFIFTRNNCIRNITNHTNKERLLKPSQK